MNDHQKEISSDGIQDLFPDAYAGNSTGPLKKAEEIMVEARQADSPKKALKLTRKALHIAPNCVDAYLFQAQISSFNEDKINENLTKAVEYARSNIGEGRFQKLAGRFGDDNQTDLFLRASIGLAQFLYSDTEYEKSREVLAEIIELDKKDRYRIKPLLAASYLLDGQPDMFRLTLYQYRSDKTADMAYLQALQSFRENGDSRKARKQLRKAMQSNRFVPYILLDSEYEIDDWDESCMPGSESEAEAYADSFYDCWEYVEGSLEWLSQETGIEIVEEDVFENVSDRVIDEFERLIFEPYSETDKEILTGFLEEYNSPFDYEDAVRIITPNMYLENPPSFIALSMEMFPFDKKVRWKSREMELDYKIAFGRLYHHLRNENEPSEAEVEKYIFSAFDPVNAEMVENPEKVVKQLLERNNRINIALRYYEQIHPDGIDSVPAQTYIQLSYVGKSIDDTANGIWKSRKRYSAYDFRETLDEWPATDEQLFVLLRAFISLIDIPIPDEIPKGEYMHILESIERMKE